MYGLADLLLKLLIVSLTWMYINETVKNVFCLQMQIKSCIKILICLHVHNKHKTKLNGAFHRPFWIQKQFTTVFEGISLQELNKCPQKFYFVGKKTWWPIICAQKLKSLTATNELKIIILVLNYLTVLVYTLKKKLFIVVCLNNIFHPWPVVAKVDWSHLTNKNGPPSKVNNFSKTPIS